MTDHRSSPVTVGLDVHARSIALAAVRGSDELLDQRTLPYDHATIVRQISRWPGARCCYEAGPTGFALARHLREQGIDCEVIAPGLVPTRADDRIKTDRCDAKRLAALHPAGLLTPIEIPAAEIEAIRDLVRACDRRSGEGRADRHFGRQAPLPARRRHLTAVGIAVEVGDFTRFGSATEFMNLVGLVP